jgi:hypothetical protein
VASLVSAYMSTMSSQLNWGASYLVNDFYRRFGRPRAGEKELVLVGRVTTVLLMAVACTVALYLENALQAFSILLTIGAGTGLLFILRGFVRLVQPGGRGWKKVEGEARADGEDLRRSGEKDHLPQALLSVLVGSIAVYSTLFAIGYGLYGNMALCVSLTALSLCGTVLVGYLWRRVWSR